MTTFDRKDYFDLVRIAPFNGSMTQSQVDGQEVLLTAWEESPASDDLRYFAYMLATTFHETAATMMPIAEYGKGAGRPYGVPDAETRQTYYGRGFVQLTWRENYARATGKLSLSGENDLEWHADQAMEPLIAVQVMFRGMTEGWFTGKRLPDYFNARTNDTVNARKIINPDNKGPLISGYHNSFLLALTDSMMVSEPVPPAEEKLVRIEIYQPQGVKVEVRIIEEGLAP